MTFDRIEVGNQIKLWRKSRKLSQEKLSEKAGISVTHLCNIENGKSTGSVESFVKIANCLSVSLDTLFKNSLKHSRDTSADDELATGLEDCSNLELQYIEQVVRTTKKALREYESRIRRIYENEV